MQRVWIQELLPMSFERYHLKEFREFQLAPKLFPKLTQMKIWPYCMCVPLILVRIKQVTKIISEIS